MFSGKLKTKKEFYHTAGQYTSTARRLISHEKKGAENQSGKNAAIILS
jgi:hypothetical protein